jgi:hypothetical protein
VERIIDRGMTDGYRLTSGRVFHANNGIIGIGPDCGKHGLSEGYDGGIVIECDWDPSFQPWTSEERNELADEMIRRWVVFRAYGLAPLPAKAERPPTGTADR